MDANLFNAQSLPICQLASLAGLVSLAMVIPHRLGHAQTRFKQHFGVRRESIARVRKGVHDCLISIYTCMVPLPLTYLGGVGFTRDTPNSHN